ncbi:MAG: hypothetical protein QXW83_00125 [Nitrososphaerales archaeon]
MSALELREIITLLIRIVNKEIDLKKLKEEVSPNEDRSLLFRIVDDNYSCGFVVDMSGLNPSIRIEKHLETPTVIVSMNKDTFFDIIEGKTTFAIGFCTGKIQLSGEHRLRDYIIFKNLEGILRQKLLTKVGS